MVIYLLPGTSAVPHNVRVMKAVGLPNLLAELHPQMIQSTPGKMMKMSSIFEYPTGHFLL